MRAMILRTLPFLILSALPTIAAESDPVRGHATEGRLIAAENAVSGATVTAGLDLAMDEGWKTYWRSPGEVGLPPALDWSGSENVASVDLAFPAPTRFTAFDIENYGYADEVVFPLAVTAESPGEPMRLSVRADLLVCADLCVPESLNLSLDLPGVGGADVSVDAEAAARLGDWIARVPGEDGFALDAVHLTEDALTLTATSDAPLTDPQIFPEQGDYASFGPPEIVADGRTLWARLPVLNPGEGALDVTLVDGARAATLPAATLADAAPLRPGGGGGAGLWAALGAALLGGLILNVMPCVLPVLSIKLTSAFDARDRTPAQVRAGFLASAAGIVGFFAALAGAVVAARAAGVVVGWGVQFQQPAFLAAMVVLMALFAANLFGLFEVSLPSSAQTALGTAGQGKGLWGDAATGAFAAVMATPCSAPFVGSAVAYALTRGAGETLAVFLAMGLGLALPYLVVAARPALVRRLPRPGRWMGTVRTALGVLMAAAAVWIATVLHAAGGVWAVAAVAVVLVVILGAVALRRRPALVGAVGLAVAAVAVSVVPTAPAAVASVSGAWEPFSRDGISARVAAGEVVFVDVTAAWCLTCKANKRLVLDRGDVADALGEVTAMQADWTRPDPAISDYLADHGRYGIPFNAVYGPGAPEGIALPEVLTPGAVMEALARAAG